MASLGSLAAAANAESKLSVELSTENVRKLCSSVTDGDDVEASGGGGITRDNALRRDSARQDKVMPQLAAQFDFADWRSRLVPPHALGNPLVWVSLHADVRAVVMTSHVQTRDHIPARADVGGHRHRPSVRRCIGRDPIDHQRASRDSAGGDQNVRTDGRQDGCGERSQVRVAMCNVQAPEMLSEQKYTEKSDVWAG